MTQITMTLQIPQETARQIAQAIEGLRAEGTAKSDGGVGQASTGGQIFGTDMAPGVACGPARKSSMPPPYSSRRITDMSGGLFASLSGGPFGPPRLGLGLLAWLRQQLDAAGIPRGTLLHLLPLIVADIIAGKSPPDILADIVAALGGLPTPGPSPDPNPAPGPFPPA